MDGPTSTTHYLEQLADLWQRYAKPGPYPLFADYCAAPSCYLECLPTYIHATAGLQASNARMSRELGDLRAAQGNASAAAARRAAADAITAATIPRLYVAGETEAEGGWWSVLDTSTGALTQVRHVIDFAYATAGFCARGPAGSACALTAAQRAQMAGFALNQLLLPDGKWVRALSLNDSAAPIPRPDHGTTGAYDAWPALLFEALTALDGGFERSMPVLKGLADVARDAPYGQAKQISGGGRIIKPVNGWTRGLANNGAAFAEAVIGSVFGYEPPWLPGRDGENWRAALKPAFAGAPRGVGGVLAGIRLPDGGYMNATLTAGGVDFSFY